MSLPSWAFPAVVVSQDPDAYSLNVTVQGYLGGQMPTLPVKVLTHGPRDAVRGHYPELPLPGTLGLIVFARGDPRSGHWIGATDPALNDASTHSPGSGQISYNARWSGTWDWHGQDGSVALVTPDGTAILLGSAMPVPTRHTVDQDHKRQRTVFTAAQRVSGAVPGPFGLSLVHPTSAALALAPSGSWAILGAPGQPVTLTVSGGASISLNGDGSITITPAGQPVTLNGELRVTGEVTAGYGTGDSVTLQLHRHGTGAAAAGTTVPTAGT